MTARDLTFTPLSLGTSSNFVPREKAEIIVGAPLHLFKVNDYDIFAAVDEADVHVLAKEAFGDDYGPLEIELVTDDTDFPVWQEIEEWEGEEPPHPPHRLISKTAGEWAAEAQRGLIFSTEF